MSNSQGWSKLQLLRGGIGPRIGRDTGTKFGDSGTTFGKPKKRLLAYIIVQGALCLYFSALAKHIGCFGPICGLFGDHLTVVEAFPFEQLVNNERGNDATLPRSHFVEVPLVNQEHVWDCGLACILMVLRTLGIYSSNIQDLEELCRTNSIWTVDLAYLLHKFSISFSYFTVTEGANPNFLMETFYKEQLPNDLMRVDMLFHKALDVGINILYRSISGQEISLLILSGKYIAIALVDHYKLSRSWVEDVCISGFYSGSSGYTGHYVVICGYDAVTDEFEIRDPASSRKHDKVTTKRLEEARKSFGTDEDLLLISLDRGVCELTKTSL